MDNNVFIVPFYFHLVFTVIAIIVLMIQFLKYKRKYQFFMGIAVSVSMLLYINPSRTWHNCIGIVELVLLAASIITSIMDKPKNNALEAEAVSVPETETTEAKEEQA